jgi:hypothetical protein
MSHVPQILDVLLLALDIQKEILVGAGDGRPTCIAERTFRCVIRSPAWAEQRRRWAAQSSAL